MKAETYPRRGPPLGCTARSRAAAQGAASLLELQPPLLIRPGPVQSSWNFYEHWSRPIDFFFLQQIFEILISWASEFLIDEMHLEETVDDKVENLASF